MHAARHIVDAAPRPPSRAERRPRSCRRPAVTPAGVLALQRSAGNRATVRALQRFHLPHTTPGGTQHAADESALVAPTFKDMLDVLERLIDDATVSGWPDTVGMETLVKSVGGQSFQDKLAKRLDIDSAKRPASPAFRYRYLFTCRCGLVDMLHFLQMLYIAQFAESMSPAIDGNAVATRKGREHELASEHGAAAESRFSAEDTTSNALGAFTGHGLPAYPRPGRLFDAIKDTLERCDPIGFGSLSATSQNTVKHFYGDLVPDPDSPSDVIPKHQSSSAAPPLVDVAECRGRERSFPFALDSDDPHFKTISGREWAAGSAAAKSGKQIRRFIHGQRLEILALVSTAEKFRMLRVLLGDDVSSDDLAAATRLHQALSAAERTQWDAQLPLPR